MSSKLAELLETQTLRSALVESFNEMHRIALDIEDVKNENHRLRMDIDVLRRDVDAIDSTVDAQMLSINKLESSHEAMFSEVEELIDVVNQNALVEDELESLTQRLQQETQSMIDDVYQKVNHELDDLSVRVEHRDISQLYLSNHQGVVDWVESEGQDHVLRLGTDRNGSVVSVSDVQTIIRTRLFCDNVERLDLSLAFDEDVLSCLIENVCRDNVVMFLIMSDSVISSELAFKILQEEPFPMLKELSLSRCPNIDAKKFLRALVSSPLGQRLERLHLEDRGLTEADRRFAFKHMPALKTLEI